MRILYHHRTLGDGAEGIHIREMVAAFRELGHEVKVFALVGEGQPSWVDKSSRWALVKKLIPEWSLELAEIGYNSIARRAVARAIREFRPDFVYDRYNLYSTAALAAARRAGTPALLEVNSPVAYERSQYEVHPLRFPRVAFYYERRTFQMADHVFAVSTPLKEHIVETANVPSDRVSVLPNGANPDYFKHVENASDVRRRLGIEGKTVVGYVGSLRPWHGLDLLVAAFAELRQSLKNIHLLVIGSGSMEKSLKLQVQDAQMDSAVTFAGPVERQNMRHYLAAMDIGVSPKATYYASPMKILEYMAMGKATVAPRMQNVLDIVDDEDNALLFEPDNRSSLAGAIERLITDTALSARLGCKARQKVESRLNWKYNAGRVIDQAMRLRSVNQA
jgi:glycosyltransferase involved in cell wall biosynthesis